VSAPAPLPDPTSSERLARVWLSARTEPGDPVVAAMVAAAGAEATVERLAGGRTPAQLVAPVDPDAAPRATAEAVLARADRRGLRWVCPGDDEWPAPLDDLTGIIDTSGRGGVPPGLWVRGARSLAAHVTDAVAVVGARASTEYGNEVAGEIAADLADAGLCLVSGAAHGIDAAGHRGALAVGGRTVAVLACGADVAYPRGHETLLDRIADQDLVVSEVAPGDHPTRVRFLARNRLIAALSRGVVVVEAAWRSGALNTLRWAGELQRHTMGVPGPVTSVLSAGVHQALRERRADLVTNAADVRELLAPLGATPVPGASGWNRGERRPIDDLDPPSRAVFEALPVGRAALPAASIAAATGIDVDTVTVVLGRLLLAGLVGRTGDGWRATPARRRATGSGERSLLEPP
jgi:DNA processing protein